MHGAGIALHIDDGCLGGGESGFDSESRGDTFSHCILTKDDYDTKISDDNPYGFPLTKKKDTGGEYQAFYMSTNTEDMNLFSKYLVKNALFYSVCDTDNDDDDLNTLGEAFYGTSDDNSPDNDGDGLLDGEEAILDKDPKDEYDPGLYVRYEPDYKTSRYWCWGYNGIAVDECVIRRNTFFTTYSVYNKDLILDCMGEFSYSYYINQLDDNRWRTCIWGSSPIGEWEITMVENYHGPTMNLYVIFELPETEEGDDRDKLTSAGRDAFLYNEDENNNKDTIAVWFWQQNEEDQQNEYKYLEARTFDTLHYSRSIFVNYVVERLKDSITVEYASFQIRNYIDEYKSFASVSSVDSMEEWLDKDNNPTSACGMFASALTSMMRSAGIPARPIVRAKYSDNNVYEQEIDHSTEVWIDGEWRVCRGYASPIPSFQKRSIEDNGWGKYVYSYVQGKSYYIATFDPLSGLVDKHPCTISNCIKYFPSDHTIFYDNNNVIIENTPYWGAHTEPGEHEW